MAASSGLDAQLAVSAETTPGTFVAPTRAFEFAEESLQLDVQRIDSSVRRSGKRVLRSNRSRINRKGAGGDTSLEVTSEQFGLFFEHMLGAVATAQPDDVGAPTVYRHTATIGALTGKSMTVQVGRPDTAGTVRPFSYLGCKVASWEMACEVDGVLTLRLTWDGMDESTDEALAAASYPTDDEVFDFTLASLTLDGATIEPSSFTLTGENGLALERYFLRGSSLKREQLEAEERAYSGSMEVEFGGYTVYDLYRNGGTAPLVATFEGSQIGATAYNHAVKVTAGAVRIDGETPTVSDDGIIAEPVPFTLLDNGTDEVVEIEYTTTDATP